MSLTALSAGVGAVGAGWFVLPHLYRRMGERSLVETCRASRSLCLTYDDGPSERMTPALLAALREGAAKATFFLLGRQVDARPEMARRIAEEGHEIGHHSQEHAHAWKTAPWAASTDLARGVTSVEREVRASRLLRPPYGKLNAWTWLATQRAGMRLAWWTTDSGDTRSRLPDAHHVCERVRAAGGGVVLMHDLDRGPERDGYVLELTAKLIDLAGAEGLRLRTLGAVLSGGDEPWSR